MPTIEDGAELEAKWEGSSRLSAKYMLSFQLEESSVEPSNSDYLKVHAAFAKVMQVVIWVQMSVLRDVVVADKQNMMSSMMVSSLMVLRLQRTTHVGVCTPSYGSSQHLKSKITRWIYMGLKHRMSVKDMVVANKQNTMLSKMDLQWY
ncbi:hypothetical protein EDB85DRAFT_1894482 [Lactarius pseudohatsudake]|nr:hypothetical protein EDB85DRAFT_1894482 [Lactarius pseudohatsudake]